MSGNIINAIDIRPDRVICLIAQELEIVNKGTFLQLIGYGIEEFPLNCSDPFQLDELELKNKIKKVILKAENESNTRIKEAYVNIFDSNKSILIDDEIDLNNSLVTEDVIKSFFKKNQFQSLYMDQQEPLHSFPISFRIDNAKSVSDPIGIKAKTLTTKWHIILSNSNQLENIMSIFESMNISITQFVASCYASTLATLNDVETSLGAVLIDIGKMKTFISYIFDNQLISFQEIPIGTYHISKDISQLMNVSIEDADDIRKRLNTIGEQQLRDKIDIDSSQIFNSRCEELVELIQREIENSKYSYLVDNNIIITGKGSKSIKIIKQIKKVMSKKHIRLGSTLKFNGLKTIVDNPSLTSSFGLLLYSSSHDLEFNGNNSVNNKNNSIFSNIYNFFKSI